MAKNVPKKIQLKSLRDFDVTYLRRAHKARLIRGTCRQLGISGIREVIPTGEEMTMAMMVLLMDVNPFGLRRHTDRFSGNREVIPTGGRDDDGNDGDLNGYKMHLDQESRHHTDRFFQMIFLKYSRVHHT